MRRYVVQPNDSRWSIIAAAILTSATFAPTAVGAYADAMVALNPDILDWTALAPNTVLALPA